MADTKKKKDTRTQFQIDMDVLCHHAAFARAVRFIRDERDVSIEELAGASREDVMQISGKILEANKYLIVFDWKKLERLHRDFL